MYERIETGLRSPMGKDCVFLWIHTEAHKVYAEYPENDTKGLAELTAPTILVGFRRKDNCFGTVGGKVDEGEDLITALIREVKEEMGLDLKDKDMANKLCKPMASFKDGDVHIHSYSICMNAERCEDEDIRGAIRYMRSQFLGATHSDEWCGLNEIVVDDKFSMFLENKFSATAKLEIDILLKEVMGVK